MYSTSTHFLFRQQRTRCLCTYKKWWKISRFVFILWLLLLCYKKRFFKCLSVIFLFVKYAIYCLYGSSQICLVLHGFWRRKYCFWMKIYLKNIVLIKIHHYSIKIHSYSIEIHQYSIVIQLYSIKIHSYSFKIDRYLIEIHRYSINIHFYSIKIHRYSIKTHRHSIEIHHYLIKIHLKISFPIKIHLCSTISYNKLAFR